MRQEATAGPPNGMHARRLLDHNKEIWVGSNGSGTTFFRKLLIEHCPPAQQLEVGLGLGLGFTVRRLISDKPPPTVSANDAIDRPHHPRIISQA